MTRRGRRRLRDIVLLTTGIGMGTVAALLVAPYTGEEARFALRRGSRKVAKRIGRHTEDLRGRAEDLLEHAQDFREHAQGFGKKGWNLLRRYRAA